MREAVLHDHDPGAHGHRLGLVVCDVDHRRLEALVKLADLGARLDAELGIEVRQRLIEQKDLRLPDDGTADGNALTLPARERLGAPVEKLLDTEDLGRLAHACIDLLLRILPKFQTERHVVVDGHVRIESVVLEDHRDVAVLRRNIVDQPVVDVDLTLRHVLQPRDHPKQRRLPAPRWSHQHDELAILDGQTHVAHSDDAAIEDLLDVLDHDVSHPRLPGSLSLRKPLRSRGSS